MKKHTQSYDEWVTHVNDGNEPVRANPDQLTEDAQMFPSTNVETKERLKDLLKTAKQILTEQQYKVFDLLALRSPVCTQREVAKKLGISHGRVAQLWEIARVKLQKAYTKSLPEEK